MKVTRIYERTRGRKVSLTIAADVAGSHARIGVAFQSPDDDLWKQKGTLIATGRAKKRPIALVKTDGIVDKNGSIDTGKLIETTISSIKKKRERAKAQYKNPMVREQETHLPRWLDEFLSVWESNHSEPQLPHMPKN